MESFESSRAFSLSRPVGQTFAGGKLDLEESVSKRRAISWNHISQASAAEPVQTAGINKLAPAILSGRARQVPSGTRAATWSRLQRSARRAHCLPSCGQPVGGDIIWPQGARHARGQQVSDRAVAAANRSSGPRGRLATAGRSSGSLFGDAVAATSCRRRRPLPREVHRRRRRRPIDPAPVERFTAHTSQSRSAPSGRPSRGSKARKWPA